MDTQQSVDRLKAAGLSDEAARAVVGVIRDGAAEKSEILHAEDRTKWQLTMKLRESEVRILTYFFFGFLLSGAALKFFGVL